MLHPAGQHRDLRHADRPTGGVLEVQVLEVDPRLTDLGQQPPQEIVEGTASRDDFLSEWAGQWRALDPAEYPFMLHIADEFEGHDDADQFAAGLDLLLAGLRLQAGT